MGDNVAKEANSGQKDKVFWVLWAIEMLVMLLWLWDELKLEFLSVNPFIYLGFIILLVSLVIKKVAGMDKLALLMVSVPGLLLGIMALFLLMVLAINTFAGPIRWN
ncbi:MAG: hypothetical protein IPP06_17360 [Saprospiraceae bacterium]|nr:hypothetical protein [Saprospiraceae bacterium]MBK9963022.1 hypothetical protein [Candidatus Vicinibacter affinis]MBK7787989.1 hypothetical protein [Saprospiraceae bacterium]MBK8111894.1 hypothetical protein [Saprospiraceae bacterium]MBK8851849.1 hypothetical protein [Saprospiraceae bacterium]